MNFSFFWKSEFGHPYWYTGMKIPLDVSLIWCAFSEIWSLADNFLIFWVRFCPFTPPNNLKNENLEKNEKDTWRYHHFTLVYHK